MHSVFELAGYTTLLLLVVALVAHLSRRFKVPHTVVLVAVGLLIPLAAPVALQLTPEVILGLFVPPLIFEAASNLHWRQLRKNLLLVAFLAIPGVLISAGIVGLIVSRGAGLAWMPALVFGALIGATDPVAVVAIYRQLGLPAQLTELIEGESLLNDGTSIVIYSLMLSVALDGAGFSLGSLVAFARVSLIGVGLGVGIGMAAAWTIARVDDYLIETTLTIVVAFGSYEMAEVLGGSGVLAVVVAGLIVGNHAERAMSPSTHLILFRFWDHAAFLANSLIFLLIGMQVNLADLADVWRAIVWAIVAVLASRAIIVYGFGWLGRIALNWQHVMAWGGLRGAISLALALSLPLTMGPVSETLRLMTFGVVVFTILVQATTMRGLITRLGLTRISFAEMEAQRRKAHRISLQATEIHLKYLHSKNLLSSQAVDCVLPDLRHQLAQYEHDGDDQVAAPNGNPDAMEDALVQREMRRAQLDALKRLLHSGEIAEVVYEELAARVDGR